MRVSPFQFAMYEGIFAMGLRCTPCKTGKESVYSGKVAENIFWRMGIKQRDGYPWLV
jgi:hypothetical protein